MDLGDARRNERAKRLLTKLAETPTASIPRACQSWSETMGAYRFMENQAFDWRDILQPHWQRTQARERNPARWSRATRNWTPAGVVTLNPEHDSIVAMAAQTKVLQPLVA